ncbi:DUF4192 domain-containing protein [Kineosporia sp. R_H_3]|uniref:DUF4192 domain-containing protein n=1 Tax=Kineosporia sp. R_H_3 TaxID=1961848 RepID=UPI00130458E2|nr:DUF4192 domain-containing protein [Kineosporia sp. R_H_3]
MTAVPYLLGFHPDPGSIVVLGLHERRIAITARVDASAVHTDPTEMWRRLAGPLADADTHAVALIGYMPADEVDIVFTLAATSPLPVLEMQRVDDGRWWSLTCTQDCCPPGQPISSDTPVDVALIAASGSPAPTRDSLNAHLQPGPDELVDDVAAHLPRRPRPTTGDAYRAIDDAHTARTDGPLPLTPDEASLLLQALADVVVRDAASGWHDDAAWWLWTDLIRTAPTGWIAPAATLLATTTYQRGNAVLARLAAEHALRDNPDYALAQLVVGLTEAHVHPGQLREALSVAVRDVAELHPGLADLMGGDPDA